MKRRLNTFTEVEQKAICRDYQNFIYTPELSKKYNTFISNINRILRRNNIPIYKIGFANIGRKSSKRIFSDTTEKIICQKYINRISPKCLADEYDCDQKTIYNLLKRHNIKRLGHRHLGEPYIDRFHKKYTIVPNGCWQWKNWKNRARIYPSFGYVDKNGIAVMEDAHRFSYKLHKGKIVKGKHIHHTCKNPACVNPEHLEMVSKNRHPLLDNTITGNNKKKTHCPYGHPYSEKNTYITKKGFRQCKMCAKIRDNIKHNRINPYTQSSTVP